MNREIGGQLRAHKTGTLDKVIPEKQSAAQQFIPIKQGVSMLHCEWAV